MSLNLKKIFDTISHAEDKYIDPRVDKEVSEQIYNDLKDYFDELYAQSGDAFDAYYQVKKMVENLYPRYVYADEEMPKVTIDDYFISTYAVFTPVGKGEELWEDLKGEEGMEFNHSSQSGSQYLYNTNTDEIYRKSNHWGNVSSCIWYFGDNDRLKYYNNVIGKCKIDDFERLHKTKESSILRPNELETYSALRKLEKYADKIESDNVSNQ